MERVAIIGLGYVGLPVAVAIAERFPATIGFDIDATRIDALIRGEDWTGEIERDRLAGIPLTFSTDPEAMRGASFFIVTVPTPIDAERRPNLGPIRSACQILGRVIAPGAVIVFESTVYPGVTEEICGPLIEAASGLRRGVDFTLGYSPERINPGDRLHTLDRIVKVIAAEDAPTLGRLEAVYGAVISAGLHRAASIRVAEAAKVLENTQRDLNIALMNEVALICDRLGIRTHDVLQAAATKWNFLPFQPGLVGGHCIGVDPYYLTTKAEMLGYHPQVILAGRRINDGMGSFIAQRMVKLLIEADLPVRRARIGVLGLAFKENVRDLRNSRIPDIVRELRDFGIDVQVHDPLCEEPAAREEYAIDLVPLEALDGVDGLILAVPHRAFLDRLESILGLVRPGGVLIDVKSALDPARLPKGLRYWSL